jgi:hypothetical protein
MARIFSFLTILATLVMLFVLFSYSSYTFENNSFDLESISNELVLYKDRVLMKYANKKQDKSNYIIHSKGIGNINIGCSFEKFASIIEFSYIEVNSDNCLVFYNSNNSRILEISDKDWGRKRVVRMIKIFSDSFGTKDGIYPGIDINSLTNILNILKEKTVIYLSSEEDREWIIPSKYNINPDITFAIELSSRNKSNSIIGKYVNIESEPEGLSTTNFDTNGYVSCIVIFTK